MIGSLPRGVERGEPGVERGALRGREQVGVLRQRGADRRDESLGFHALLRQRARIAVGLRVVDPSRSIVATSSSVRP